MGEYTEYMNRHITNCDIDPFEMDAERTVEILNDKNFFRSFSDGLTMLLSEAFPQAELNTIEQKAAVMYEALSKIGSELPLSTVLTWFNEKHRPERSAFIEICFALHLDFDGCKRAFSHVYFDRCFNCHNKRELIYYFCIRNGQSWQTANEIISDCPDIPQQENPSHNAVYTRYIRSEVDELKSIEQLKQYIADHEYYFSSCNIKAKEQIQSILESLRGNSCDKAYISAFREYYGLVEQGKRATPPDHLLKHCSITMRWLRQSTDSDESFLESLKNAQPMSDSFILKAFLSGTDGLRKSADIPEYVRRNFPSKQRLYSILKSEQSTQYDSIRRTLILFAFIEYWCRISLGLKPELNEMDNDRRFIIFRQQMDAILDSCDYEKLYAGSPFDWLILYLSRHDDPLQELVDFLGEIDC